jgi:hypothetical protein
LVETSQIRTGDTEIVIIIVGECWKCDQDMKQVHKTSIADDFYKEMSISTVAIGQHPSSGFSSWH